MKHKPRTVTIDAALLERLVDRVDGLTAKGQTHGDVAMIDQARHVLRPRKPSPSDKWMHLMLEGMRLAREAAIEDGRLVDAFELATAIDRKKGFYA